MDWTRGPTIGRGSSATVSLATTAAGHLFAVKSADVASSNSLQNEQNLISQLCSPYIIKSFGSETTSENNKSICNIFLEYVPGGTLADLVRAHGGALPENKIQLYANQLLKGLNYLHANGIVHCDIKGQNILIGDEGLKIADFGCAKRAECGGGVAGTPAYMAPEAALGEEQGFPADVWAVGCTVIEMATGGNPWPEMKDPVSVLYRVGFSGESPEIPEWFSDDARDFVAMCLIKCPTERWTAEKLLQHPFFNSVVNCVKESPTSVIDQCFWDAVEVSDSDSWPGPSGSGLDDPAERISGLIGDFGGMNFEMDGLDWVTVRGYETEDLVIDGEDIEVSDSLLNSFSDEIISRIDFSGSQVLFGAGEIDDFSSRNNVSFDGIAMKNFFDSHQFFYLRSFYVLFHFFHGVVPLIF